LSSPPDTDTLDREMQRLVTQGVLSRDEAAALLDATRSGQSRSEALPSGMDDKDRVKEQAARDKRHWVRTTRVCNQRCTFCLDSMNQDGTRIETAALKTYIALGRRLGRERLILSGGEATVHPEFLELVRYGREVGYDWIQVVTNGMMFSYKGFARAAARAGLNEATVSMHGHTAQLHDKLTGTPSAFVTGLQGIRNLQATGQVVVNIDIVLNKQNYRVLPEMLAFWFGHGIREFDLLHLVPFGRGFDEHRASLFFDLNDAVPYFRRAFAWADQPGVYLWTNRMPVTYLEGFERLIQEPHKLQSEFDGGRHNFEGWLRTGVKPDCWGERCDYCFLEGPCRATLLPYRERLLQGEFASVRVDSRLAWPGDAAQRAFRSQRPTRLRVTAPDATTATETLKDLAFPLARRDVALADGADPTALLGQADRFVVSTLAQAHAYLLGAPALPADVEIEVALTRELAGWLLDHPEVCRARGHRLIAALQTHEFRSGVVDHDPDPQMLQRLAQAGVRLKAVPRCIAGAEVEPADRPHLDAALLDGAGHLDLDRFVHHYIVHEYRVKSLRCVRCAEVDRCDGLHINYLREHGFGVMMPQDADGRPLSDATSFETLTEALRETNARRSREDLKRLVGRHRPEAQAQDDASEV
jgi:pyruvate-formate lyase-activating enzyme